jgi:hypothetical protein
MSFSFPLITPPVLPPLSTPIAAPVPTCPEPEPPVAAPVAAPVNATMAPNATEITSATTFGSNETEVGIGELEVEDKSRSEESDNTFSAAKTGMAAVLSVAAAAVIAAVIARNRKNAASGKAAAGSGSDASTATPYSDEGSPIAHSKNIAEI